MGDSQSAATLDPEVEQLILQVLSEHADTLLATARHNSLCLDDAHDAYQRAMEIFMRRASSLRRQDAVGWLNAVIRNEARAVRRTRLQLVGTDEVHLDEQPADAEVGPEERAIGSDRADRAAEALKRLKPDELRAIWLRALGLSYAEISEQTGWSNTKINRALAEGRTSFMDRYAGIESGEECRRWAPLLSAVVDGEATSAQLLELRPHTRNCPACRATMRELSSAESALRIVLPAGAAAVAGRAAMLIERILPVGPSADAALAAGGIGSAAAAITKVAAVIAVSAASVTVAGGEPAQSVAVPKAVPAAAAAPTPALARATAVTTRPAQRSPSSKQATTPSTKPQPSPTARKQALAAREFIPARAPEAPEPPRTRQSQEFTP
jgi:RNA polymerase sigma factor (sigma-70 family)